MLSLVSSFREVLFFFSSSPHHIGGLSRVAEAMSEVEQEPLNQSKVDEEKRSNPPSPRRSRSPHGKDQAYQDQQVEEPPKPEHKDSAMEAEAKSLGRHLMETLTSASQSLLECSEKLEKNVVLLEECRADSSSIQSLAAGVNYYASTTKASQASAAAQHKQIAWDWLSDPKDRQPLKDTLKSVRYQCECTSKAAYQVVEVSKEILEELKSHKETMTEQSWQPGRIVKADEGDRNHRRQRTSSAWNSTNGIYNSCSKWRDQSYASCPCSPFECSWCCSPRKSWDASIVGPAECLWAFLHAVYSSSEPSNGGAHHREVLGVSAVGCPELRAERKPKSADGGIQWARSP